MCWFLKDGGKIELVLIMTNTYRERNNKYVDWLVIYFFFGAYGKACVKMEIGCQSLKFLMCAALFVLYQKSALYNTMSFLDMLEHYHWAFQKGISLRVWIDIKFVTMCYPKFNYTVKLLVYHPLTNYWKYVFDITKNNFKSSSTIRKWRKLMHTVIPA